MYRMRYIETCFLVKTLVRYRIRYMNLIETGAQIREAREKAGLTQAQVARRLGMSRATISKVENGIIEELGVRKLARVSDLLGLEITIQPRRVMTLHDAYQRNRKDRREAFRQTDATLANLKPDAGG
jgi:transcriptional regulator with XRE-family HTH domain